LKSLSKSHVGKVAALCVALAAAFAAHAPVSAAQPAAGSQVVLVSRIKVKPGAEGKFEAAIRDFYAQMRLHDPGSIANIMYRQAGAQGASDGPFGRTPPKQGVFVFYEVYADQAAAQAHPPFQGLHGRFRRPDRWEDRA
jgi:quinol monooxygenase YgiN